MSRDICIFEDGAFVNFFPLSLAQPVFDLRVGAGTLAERWRDEAAKARVSLICRDYLAECVRLGSPRRSVNEPTQADTLFVNARWLCFDSEREGFVARLDADTVAIQDGAVVAARVGRAKAADFANALRAQVSDHAVDAACARLKSLAGAGASDTDDVCSRGLPADVARVIAASNLRRVDWTDARLLNFPWEIIEHNAACIRDDAVRVVARGHAKDATIHSGAHIVEPKQVAIGAKVQIRAGAVIDASDGPVLIGELTVVMPNATIVGPVAIGAASIVRAGARVLGCTSIGNVCKVGGEVDEAVFADYSNKQHDGFLGHSYVGSWVNIGAATNNSDLKNNYGTVRMWCAGRVRESNRQFLGLVMGDHAKTGINAVFNTGTVVGFNCNIYSSEMPGAFVPSFSWGHGSEMVPYQLEKAVHTATLAMKRRGVDFTEAHRRLFARVHDMVEKSGRNA